MLGYLAESERCRLKSDLNNLQLKLNGRAAYSYGISVSTGVQNNALEMGSTPIGCTKEYNNGTWQ